MEFFLLDSIILLIFLNNLRWETLICMFLYSRKGIKKHADHQYVIFTLSCESRLICDLQTQVFWPVSVMSILEIQICFGIKEEESSKSKPQEDVQFCMYVAIQAVKEQLPE
jgi:hypothetical protein